MRVLPGCFVLLMLAACRGDKPGINVSQTLIVETSVLASGIIAAKPSFNKKAPHRQATSVLYNQRQQPVQVKYRFYWYNEDGLEIVPYALSHTVWVPAGMKITIASQTDNLSASHVRLYLYR